MLKNSAKKLAVAVVLVTFAGPASAKIVKLTFTTTISSTTTPGITVGDTMTLDLLADNGGNSIISQTWNYADLLGFTIKAGSYAASYSKVFESPLTRNFITDASGILTRTNFNGTYPLSNNMDNFGTWTGNTVFSGGTFLIFMAVKTILTIVLPPSSIGP